MINTELPIGNATEINFHEKQWLAFICKATEVLFGGSAGPGKSHLLRIAAIIWCAWIPGLQVYFFRRVEDDLQKNHMEGPKGFRSLLADLAAAWWVTITHDEIRFWNGSRIFLCHCKDEAHRYKYHGAEIHVLIIDELTTFTEVIYRYLRFRVRMVGITLPKIFRKGEIGIDGQVNEWDLFPKIICGSNPGNIGHHWVKRTWGLDRALGISEPMMMPDSEGGMYRQYIRALLSDNPSMERDDPRYRQRMRGLQDPALVRAMEEGDWNILAGGYFPEFRLERHVLKACTLPDHKFPRRFRSWDWGSARPFSIGWYGICDEDWKTDGCCGNEIIVPRGSIVRYREWYGKKENEDNRGLKMPVQSVAEGVLKRTTKGENITYDVVDGSMFDEDGGPSLAERAMAVRDKLNRQVRMRPADKRRIPGWNEYRARLNGNADPKEFAPPLCYWMDNQPDNIRIIQAVTHDETKIEDVDTDIEDHAVDENRYAFMSRPLPTNKGGRKRKPKGPKPWTMEWLDNVRAQQEAMPAVRRRDLE